MADLCTRAPGKHKDKNGGFEAVSEVTIHTHWILSVSKFLDEIAHRVAIVGDDFKEERK